MTDPGELDAAHDEANLLDAVRSQDGARIFRLKLQAAGIGYEPEGPEVYDMCEGLGPGEVE